MHVVDWHKCLFTKSWLQLLNIEQAAKYTKAKKKHVPNDVVIKLEFYPNMFVVLK